MGGTFLCFYRCGEEGMNAPCGRFEECLPIAEKSAVLAEFSTVLVENSASTVNFCLSEVRFSSKVSAKRTMDANLSTGMVTIKNNQYLCFVMVGGFRRHASIIMNSQEEFARLLTQTVLRPDGATAAPRLHHRKTSGDAISASLCHPACLSDFSFPVFLFSTKGNAASSGFPPLFRNHLCGSTSQFHNLTQDARIRTHRQDISRS